VNDQADDAGRAPLDTNPVPAGFVELVIKNWIARGAADD
jgi:hypothetical protein